MLGRRKQTVGCRASLFIKLPCQTSFCPFFIFFVSLLSAVVCDSSFYYVHLSELGTANLNSIPQPQIPQNCKRCSAIANPQVCDRFAVTFCTSATANAHSTSANLDRNIYCYFVFVMTFFIFEGQILSSTRG